MMRTLWSAGAAGRLGMLAAVIVVSTLGRLSGAFMPEGTWPGSERQAMYGVLLTGLVIPVFVAMLGANLLRGEHAPWSWGLARPISRGRLIGGTAALDAITIALCVAAAGGVLGRIVGPLVALVPPWVSLSPWAEGAALGVLGAAYVAFYLACAIAGAWTASAVRAAVLGLGGAMGFAAALYELVTTLAGHELRARLVHADWAAAYVMDSLPSHLGAVRPFDPFALLVLGMIFAAAALPVGLLVGCLRAATVVPARPPVTRLLRPAILGALLGASLCVASLLSFRSKAPAEARYGDITVEVEVVGELEPRVRLWEVRLSYDSELVSQPRVSRHASRGSERSYPFDEISAGAYLACATLMRPAEAPRWRDEYREVCTPAVIRDAPALQRVEIDLRVTPP